MRASRPSIAKILRRLKWPALVGCLLFVLLLALHRPILFEITRRLIVRTAEGQRMKIDYELGGSIFTTLRVTDVVAYPPADSPIRRLEIAEIGLQYDLIGFVRHGYPALLKTIRLTDFHLELDQTKLPVPAPDPAPSPAEPEPSASEKPRSEFPLLFPERVEITDFSLVSHTPEGDFAFTGFTLLLLPDRPGTLKVGRFQAPGSTAYENLIGQTTFHNRDLVLTDLKIGPEIKIDRFQFDASALGENRVGLALDSHLFGGTASLDIALRDIYGSYQSTLQAHAEAIALDRISSFLNLPAESAATGTIADLTLNYEGKILTPRSWIGDGRAEFADLQFKRPKIDHFLAEFTLEKGLAQVDLRDLRRADNTITGKLSTRIPESLGELPPDNYQGTITIDAPDLSTLIEGASQVPTGAVVAEGTVNREGAQIDADLAVTAKQLAYQDIGLAGAKLSLTFSKTLPESGVAEPVFTNLKTTITGHADHITYKNYEADKALIDLTTTNDQLALKRLEVNYLGNSVRLEGSYQTPEDPLQVDLDLLDLKLAIDAPRLEDFIRDSTGRALSGSLKLDADLHRDAGLYAGGLTIEATNLAFNGYEFRQFTLDAPVEKSIAELRTLALDLGEAGTIEGHGTIGIESPHPYTGDLKIALTDLAAINAPIPVEGQFAIDWQGSGEVTTRTHSGSLDLDLKNGRYQDLENLTATLSALYTPDDLSISDLSLGLAGQTVITGNLALPLDLQNKTQPIPRDRPIAIDLATPTVAIDRIFALLQKPAPPVTGTVKIGIIASGTLTTPDANVTLQGRDLQPTQLDRIEPAELDLTLVVASGDVHLDATLRQRRLEPVTIDGHFPLDAGALIAGEKFDPDAPLEVRLDIPALDLGFVPTLVPSIKFLEGSASANVDITGTLRAPQFAGTAALQAKRLAFASDAAPEIDAIDAEFGFDREKITITELDASIGKGPLSLSGTVALPAGSKPVLDLSIDGKSLLLARNKSLIARANTAITLTGPTDSAHLAGRIGLVDSRLFKQILILPIGSPAKRNAPKPPSTGGPKLSFPNPPLRDWTFDLAIGTDSPFLIRGNIANGNAEADLRLTGTGLKPRLEGRATVDDLIASLPFSTLDIERGSLYFNPDRPLDPVLDLRGRSELRDYVINTYISGSSSDPEVTFSSQPPLPPEDIIALLSTGATARELTGKGEVIAGRAALLVLQQFYQRFFPSKTADSQDSFRDQLDTEVGALDPKTGKQSISARYRITPSFHLIGDLDVNGNTRGRLRYLLRIE